MKREAGRTVGIRHRSRKLPGNSSGVGSGAFDAACVLLALKFTCDQTWPLYK